MGNGWGAGGGGASNFATGTFTTPSTTSTNGTVTVPYTGTGYPIALIIFVEGGVYNPAISGWYDSLVGIQSDSSSSQKVLQQQHRHTEQAKLRTMERCR